MERRFSARKQQMLAECEVSSQMIHGMLQRLNEFIQPFAEALRHPNQRPHAESYIHGLLSDLKRKNAEAIAYQDEQDRRGLQHFLGTAEWDHRPLQRELARGIGEELKEADAVLVFDPSAFPKWGKLSLGVARQWCGRLGKVDNCQVATYLGYVTRDEHALVDTRLYLPQEWTQDRKRCQKAGVPKGTRHQTRHAQALEMLEQNGPLLPHAWIAGDDEMGKCSHFRRDLQERGEQYLLAVPANTTIRDLDAESNRFGQRGQALRRRFEQVQHWRDRLPESAWKKVVVRDGDKRPLQVELTACRVLAKISRRNMPYEETLVVIRYRDEGGIVQHDFYLSNVPAETPWQEFARVSKAAHRIEECIKRGKSEAGLADYQVRNWKGWHHHQILSLLACWFLVLETRRGKKMDASHHASANPRSLDAPLARDLEPTDFREVGQSTEPPAPPQRRSPLLSPQGP